MVVIIVASAKPIIASHEGLRQAATSREKNLSKPVRVAATANATTGAGLTTSSAPSEQAFACLFNVPGPTGTKPCERQVNTTRDPSLVMEPASSSSQGQQTCDIQGPADKRPVEVPVSRLPTPVARVGMAPSDSDLGRGSVTGLAPPGARYVGGICQFPFPGTSDDATFIGATDRTRQDLSTKIPSQDICDFVPRSLPQDAFPSASLIHREIPPSGMQLSLGGNYYENRSLSEAPSSLPSHQQHLPTNLASQSLQIAGNTNTNGRLSFRVSPSAPRRNAGMSTSAELSGQQPELPTASNRLSLASGLPPRPPCSLLRDANSRGPGRCPPGETSLPIFFSARSNVSPFMAGSGASADDCNGDRYSSTMPSGPGQRDTRSTSAPPRCPNKPRLGSPPHDRSFVPLDARGLGAIQSSFNLLTSEHQPASAGEQARQQHPRQRQSQQSPRSTAAPVPSPGQHRGDVASPLSPSAQVPPAHQTGNELLQSPGLHISPAAVRPEFGEQPDWAAYSRPPQIDSPPGGAAPPPLSSPPRLSPAGLDSEAPAPASSLHPTPTDIPAVQSPHQLSSSGPLSSAPSDGSTSSTGQQSQSFPSVLLNLANHDGILPLPRQGVLKTLSLLKHSPCAEAVKFYDDFASAYPAAASSNDQLFIIGVDTTHNSSEPASVFLQLGSVSPSTPPSTANSKRYRVVSIEGREIPTTDGSDSTGLEIDICSDTAEVTAVYKQDGEEVASKPNIEIYNPEADATGNQNGSGAQGGGGTGSARTPVTLQELQNRFSKSKRNSFKLWDDARRSGGTPGKGGMKGALTSALAKAAKDKKNKQDDDPESDSDPSKKTLSGAGSGGSPGAAAGAAPPVLPEESDGPTNNLPKNGGANGNPSPGSPSWRNLFNLSRSTWLIIGVVVFVLLAVALILAFYYEEIWEMCGGQQVSSNSNTSRCTSSTNLTKESESEDGEPSEGHDDRKKEEGTEMKQAQTQSFSRVEEEI